ncbi:DUF4407 domain-containing protein [Tsukamurella ocularis]|uniref:DUF4407 domain-containing protein n=1 Tax=Tsukamurella ocularis TaxID=1970234 RepID=UPI00216A886D|nr:DUF4407 domain-containing protein [Tsukamurella ocularis]MCS3779636.1 hypothetical protein [Tsukamurella ocularis]MCS3788964.1 hypothetical protein [Tsukamurella ocularis]MCS3850174.1 hypothetical protein [Tsukamurella ocularis]
MTTILVAAVFALLIGGAICLAVAAPGRRAALPSRCLVSVLIGLVVGELFSMLVLNGAIEDRLRGDADTAAASAPAVRAAQAELDAARADRTALDTAVAEASTRRDQALVVARCEYRPGPACPQTSITGVPGRGPEARTANERLASAQTDLDRATATRAKDAPGRDARVVTARTEAAAARQDATAGADDGLGARWVALNGVTAHSLPTAALRIAIDLVCVVLALLPLLLRLWRGETVRDIRRRRDLESERLASAAQLAIERRDHERRVELAIADDRPTELLPALGGAAAGAAALEAAGFEPVAVTARRYRQEIPAVNDDFLPIAAAAEAASLAARAPGQPPGDETPTGPLPVTREVDATPAPADESTEETVMPDETNLPARVADTAPAVPAREIPHKPNPFVPPVLDEAARTIAGFVRPLMPPIVARVLPGGGGSGTRTVQQSYEEVEEVTFAMRRTRKVVVGTVEQSLPAPPADGAPGPAAPSASAEEPLDVAHEPVAGLPGERARELGQARELTGRQ